MFTLAKMAESKDPELTSSHKCTKITTICRTTIKTCQKRSYTTKNISNIQQSLPSNGKKNEKTLGQFKRPLEQYQALFALQGSQKEKRETKGPKACLKTS